MTRTSDEMHVPAFVSVKRMMKQNRLTTVLLAAFLVALLYGSVLMSQADQTLQDKLSFLTQEYISNRGEQSIISTFLSSLSTNGLYLGAAFCLAFLHLGSLSACSLCCFAALDLDWLWATFIRIIKLKVFCTVWYSLCRLQCFLPLYWLQHSRIPYSSQICF